MKDCRRCRLWRTARSVCVESRGSASPIILFVGEAPGRTEDKENSTFVGESGKKFDELMQRAGLDPKFCRWTNIVRCVPWESSARKKVRPPLEEEVEACCMYLEKEIMRTKPILIVPLGATALSYFKGKKVKITEERGRRSIVELPTVRSRYRRLTEWLVFKGIRDDKVIQTSDARKEKAIQYASDKYGFKDLPVTTHTLFPSMHPASILYGNPRAEIDILNDLNYLASRIHQTDETASYQLLTTIDDVVGYLNRTLAEYRDGKFPYVAYDLETTSLDMFNPNERITTIGLSTKKHEAYVIPYDHRESPFKGDRLARAAIRGSLSKLFEEAPIVGHNLKFDYKWSSPRGIKIRRIFDDTQEMSWTLFNDQSVHDLETLTSMYTTLKLHKQEMKEAQAGLPKDERYNTDNYDLELVARYNGADVDSEQHLEPVFRQMLIDQDLYEAHCRDVQPAIIPVAEMEINGCVLDIPFLDELNESMSKDIAAIYKRFDDWGLSGLMSRLLTPEPKPGSKAKPKPKEFKLSSAEQVSVMLFDVLEFEPIRYGKVRKSGKLKGKRVPSSNKHVLLELWEDTNALVQRKRQELPAESEELQMWEFKLQVLQTLQAFKDIDKLYTAYVKAMPRKMDADHYVRPEYGIRHTETGRYNCTNPSLQVIPYHSKIKQAFISRFEDGVIISADQSQMELRLFAMVTQDPEMTRAFVEDRDIHRMIASRVLQVPEEQVLPDDRRRMKTVNFGVLYGRGKRSIAAQEGISEERAQALIDGLFTEFALVGKFVKDTHRFVRRYGFVKYVNGFRRIIPVPPDDPSWAERRAVNSMIQGPASDLVANALIDMHHAIIKRSMQAKMYQYVHDSLGFDVPPGELFDLCVLLNKVMGEVPPRKFPFCNVPLRIDFEIGISWGQLVEAKLLEGRRLEINGEEAHVDPLLSRMLNWEDAPTIVSREVEVKEKPEVSRSLVRITAPMVDYNHVTVVLEFPPYTRRTPLYAHEPLDLEAA